MKKLLAIIATIATCLALALGVSGCDLNGGDKLKVFAPDGAPALALAGISDADADKYFDVSVVNAETINSYVTGKMEADIAVLPVNAAVKLLGSGESYKMLGAVTHGNLYLLKKQDGQDISSSSELANLVGKTVGVINLANVPGLTFKVILNDNNLAFNELKDGAGAAADKVNLKSVTAQEVTPVNADCDYFVVPEPAATTKVNATEGKLSFAGSLQSLYGGESGYPQAVAVVKNSLWQSPAVDKFVKALEDARGLLLSESVTAEELVGKVRGWLVGDAKPTFTADNLSKTVIENCGINFVAAQSCKAEVIAYMQKVNAQANGSFGTPADKFFG